MGIGIYETRLFECGSDNDDAFTDYQLAPVIVRFTATDPDDEMVTRFGAHRVANDYFTEIGVRAYQNPVVAEEAYLLVKEVL